MCVYVCVHVSTVVDGARSAADQSEPHHGGEQESRERWRRTAGADHQAVREESQVYTCTYDIYSPSVHLSRLKLEVMQCSFMYSGQWLGN